MLSINFDTCYFFPKKKKQSLKLIESLVKYILILAHLLKHTNIGLGSSKLKDFNLKNKQKNRIVDKV